MKSCSLPYLVTLRSSKLLEHVNLPYHPATNIKRISNFSPTSQSDRQFERDFRLIYQYTLHCTSTLTSIHLPPTYPLKHTDTSKYTHTHKKTPKNTHTHTQHTQHTHLLSLPFVLASSGGR